MPAWLADPDAIQGMRELLVRSTRQGLELAGLAHLRQATAAELEGLGESEGWVLGPVRQTGTGEPGRVQAPPCTEGWLRLHTHPGLKGTYAGFSRADLAAVRADGCALGVVGYTTLSPELASTLGLALGWQGWLATGAVQAALRVDAGRRERPWLLHRAVVARVALPDGQIVPVRKLGAGRGRRALESAEFAVDSWVQVAADQVNDVVHRFWPGGIPGHEPE